MSGVLSNLLHTGKYADELCGQIVITSDKRNQSDWQSLLGITWSLLAVYLMLLAVTWHYLAFACRYFGLLGIGVTPCVYRLHQVLTICKTALPPKANKCQHAALRRVCLSPAFKFRFCSIGLFSEHCELHTCRIANIAIYLVN